MKKKKRLFRRSACYLEPLWWNQIVLADDPATAEGDSDVRVVHESDDLASCDFAEFAGANDVREVSLNELSEEEARQVAEHLATESEYEAISEMTLEEVQVWLKRKLKQK